MLGELLGEWMRLTGTGSVATYRERSIWLAGTADLRLEQGEPGRWLRDLSDRGFLEVDWENGRWSCSPLALTKLPAADGIAVFAGFTHPSSLNVLKPMNVDVHTADSTPPGANTLARPSATFIQYGSIADLRKAATAIGATYIPCSARQLAKNLLPVELGPPSAPPNTRNDTLVYFDSSRLDWKSPNTGLPAGGLYRYEGNGRRNYLWHENGAWRHCDMSAGIWTALARSDTSAIRWRPYPDMDPDDGSGTLFSDFGAPLPPLHRRCLVLCSGLSPRFSVKAHTAIYENVPRGIADIIWRTLGQRPHVLGKGD